MPRKDHYGTPSSMTPLSDYRKDLDFQARKKPSCRLPAWAINGHLISGFDQSPEHPVHHFADVDPMTAQQIFHDIYPHLSWPELSRLSSRPAALKIFDFPQLLALYGQSWDQNWQTLSQDLLNWSDEIQNYLTEKDIKAFDVLILKGLKRDRQTWLLQRMIQKPLSKSQFCQALELAGELILMETSIEALEKALLETHFIEELKKLRHPHTTQRDEIEKVFFDKMAAQSTKGLHLAAQRRGDTLGAEMKFFVKNSQELDRIIKGLDQISEAWKQKENDSRF